VRKLKGPSSADEALRPGTLYSIFPIPTKSGVHWRRGSARLGSMAFIGSHLADSAAARVLRGLRSCVWIPLLIGACVARAAETDAQFERWFAAQTNILTWAADFTQTRSLKVLNQPLVATGKVWMAVPDRFRWELGQPPQTIALRQPEQLFLIYPRLKRAEKYSLTGVPPGPLKDAFALLDASFPRDKATMEGRFHLLSAMETNSTLLVRLEPKSASARKFITEILIGFRTNDFSIAVTDMKFADGSSLRNDFTNTVLNQPIPPEMFDPKLGADMTVVEPLRK
jgi:outer membrane lipoprotein carrier protein